MIVWAVLAIGNRSGTMRIRFILWCTCIIFSGASNRILSSQLPAQSNPARLYSVSRELRIKGVVEAIRSDPGSRALPGAHLTLLTQAGRLDVHLGPATLEGAEAYGLRTGDQVEVTGCMVSYKEQSVLLARLVKRGNRVLTFRTKLGFPIASRGTGGQAAALRAQ
jgi:hypothetical protein